MRHKRISVDVKSIDTSEGMVEAIFSTFGVVDHDGDLTLPGAFEDGAPVAISSYNHSSWGGALPVGKGVIVTTDADARMVGEFFTNTTHGRDTFETVKQLGPLGEWSYGFDVLESSRDVRGGETVNVLSALKVFEVSPVLRGAGIGTQTVVAKTFKVEDLSDDECAERAREACKALLARGLSLPAEIVKAVRDDDARAAELTRQRETLLALAACRGIDI